MSTQQDQRRARRLEKQKKKRSEASEARARRTARQQATQDPTQAGRWPIGECYLTEGWHEDGAQVSAVFIRQSESGARAVALFDCDLAARGVLRAEARLAQDERELNTLLAMRSEQRALLSLEPELVVKLVLTAAAYGAANGSPPPETYKAAIALFGDVDPEACPITIPVGPASAPSPAPTPAPGLIRGLFGRWLGR
jgi:hypothetical protein